MMRPLAAWLARRPWTLGAVGGLVMGIAYWYGWGCRRCARTSHPMVVIGFCTVVGAGLGRSRGKDHVPPEQPRA